MEDFDLSKYIYWEYSLAVLIVTEVVRAILKNVNTNFVKLVVVDNPKWLTLVTAILLAIGDWIVFGNAQKFHFFQFTISFGCAVLGYDYVFKLVKDQLKKPTQ